MNRYPEKSKKSVYLYRLGVMVNLYSCVFIKEKGVRKREQKLADRPKTVAVNLLRFQDLMGEPDDNKRFIYVSKKDMETNTELYSMQDNKDDSDDSDEFDQETGAYGKKWARQVKGSPSDLPTLSEFVEGIFGFLVIEAEKIYERKDEVSQI